MKTRTLTGLLLVLLVAPSAVLGQTSKAGVVTVIEGHVTARRMARPDPVALKFRDTVFVLDTVATGDLSLVRVLLGGNAVVTVRERSVLTITETPGRVAIDLESGKIALGVARERMRLGEEIQIRTANGVAAVRGTVVIAEVERQSAQVGGTLSAAVTHFYVLRGAITAQLLDAARNPVGTPVPVLAMQHFSAAGLATPRVQPVSTDALGRITSGLQPTGQKPGGTAGTEQIKTQQQQHAVALLGAITGNTRSISSQVRTEHTHSAAHHPAPHIPKFVPEAEAASHPNVVFATDPGRTVIGQSANTASEIHLGNTLTIGTDQPLPPAAAGALNVSDGVRVITQQALLVDTALLAATATLLEVKGSASVLTTAADALNLHQRARLTAVGPVLRVDGGIMNVATGSAFRVSNSALLVTGDLLSVVNGAKLSIPNGGVLFASGNAAVNISGALVNFGPGGGGNQLNVGNGLCGVSACAAVGAIPVFLQNGAKLSQITVSGPAIKNASLGTINTTGPAGTNSALIIVDGPQPNVNISGH